MDWSSSNLWTPKPKIRIAHRVRRLEFLAALEAQG